MAIALYFVCHIKNNDFRTWYNCNNIVYWPL